MDTKLDVFEWNFNGSNSPGFCATGSNTLLIPSFTGRAQQLHPGEGRASNKPTGTSHTTSSYHGIDIHVSQWFVEVMYYPNRYLFWKTLRKVKHQLLTSLVCQYINVRHFSEFFGCPSKVQMPQFLQLVFRQPASS